MPHKEQSGPGKIGNADPCLTASIYCTGQLDRVLTHAIAPFLTRLTRMPQGRDCFLWTIRYNLNGEHLKLRLHGPQDVVAPARRRLEEIVDELFSALPGSPTPTPPRWKRIPPVDLEDEVDTDYPDRTLLWTTYRRNDVSFARMPFYADDRYIALATAAMGRGAPLVLDALASDPPGEVRHATRQHVLLKALLVAMPAFGFSATERRLYLTFHRDWLVRFTLLKSEVASDVSRRLLDKLDAKADGMEDALGTLSASVRALWSDPPDTGFDPDDPWQLYGRALRELADHSRRIATSDRYDVDPFAPRRYFPPLFKALHGLANQLGLSMLDEAFAYHLLLRAAGATTADPVVLIPRRRTA